MNAQWKQIKNNDELIQEKIETYLTKQKVDLAKNTLLLWKKQSNVNVSSDSNLIILDEGTSSTSAATPSTSSSTTNNEIFEKKQSRDFRTAPNAYTGMEHFENVRG